MLLLLFMCSFVCVCFCLCGFVHVEGHLESCGQIFAKFSIFCYMCVYVRVFVFARVHGNSKTHFYRIFNIDRLNGPVFKQFDLQYPDPTHV